MCYIIFTAHFQLHAREHWIVSECLFFSCTLLNLTCLITQLACSSLYLIITSLLVCARAITQAACISNMLQVLIPRYMFKRVCHEYYRSSSNSTVPVRIGNHTRKCRALILLVMTNFYYLSQFNLLTTADSAIPLYTCSRNNPVIENNRSGTLSTMCRLS